MSPRWRRRWLRSACLHREDREVEVALLGPPQPGVVLPQLDLRTKVQTPAAARSPHPGPLQRREGGGAARPRVCAGRACRSWRSKGKPSSS
jgi:hypothetical protein